MRPRGFSLVEVVLSFCLLTVVLMLVFNLFPTSAVAIERARMETQANSMAQARLESARLKPFKELTVGSNVSEVVKEGADQFEIVQSVNKVAGESQDRLVSVKVTVDWEYRKRRHQSIQEAYVFRLQR